MLISNDICYFIKNGCHNVAKHPLKCENMSTICIAYGVSKRETNCRHSSVKHFFRCSQIRLVKANTNTGRYLLAGRSAFEGRSGRDTITLYMVWGLKKQDLSDCKSWEIDCPGRTVWDDKFDMNSEFAQLALLVSTQRRGNVYVLLKVVGYYDLSVQSMSVMGFLKKIGWGWVGGVSSIQCCF